MNKPINVPHIVAKISESATAALELLSLRRPELKPGDLLPPHYVGNTLKKICAPIPFLAGAYDSSPARVFIEATDPQAKELIEALNKAEIKVAWDIAEFTEMSEGEKQILSIDPSMKIQHEEIIEFPDDFNLNSHRYIAESFAKQDNRTAVAFFYKIIGLPFNANAAIGNVNYWLEKQSSAVRLKNDNTRVLSTHPADGHDVLVTYATTIAVLNQEKPFSFTVQYSEYRLAGGRRR